MSKKITEAQKEYPYYSRWKIFPWVSSKMYANEDYGEQAGPITFLDSFFHSYVGVVLFLGLPLRTESLMQKSSRINTTSAL